MSKSRKSIAKRVAATVKLEESDTKSPDRCGESNCLVDGHRRSTWVDTDCDNALQQFINASIRIAESHRTDDAKRIAVHGTESLNVILRNIEWLVREQNQTFGTTEQLDEHLERVQSENVKLAENVANLIESNVETKRQNELILNDNRAEEQNLQALCGENQSFETTIQTEKSKVQDELQKLARASTQLENDVVQRGVQWDNEIFLLQNRLAQLQYDHETLTVNYQSVRNALRANNSGDVLNVGELLDAGATEARHETEMMTVKHDHARFISQMNKLNYKLWTEKFFTRSKLDEQVKKSQYYEKWMEALNEQNAVYQEAIFSLNKQIEELLDVICSKMKMKCNEKALTDRNSCSHAA